MKNILPVILIYCFTVWVCPELIYAQEKLTPKEAAEARRIIINWLECEECTDGELEAVLKLEKIAIPSLAASLHGGPSKATLELQRRHLITTYHELKKYGESHPESVIKMREKEYVKIYTDNFIALYQIRAAEALAAIGGSDAKRELEKALKIPLRNDVKTSVKNSLEKLKRQ